MDTFMGWSAERGRDGRWVAVKVLEKEGYSGGAGGVVRMRHAMPRLRKSSTASDAMREIRSLYVRGALR